MSYTPRVLVMMATYCGAQYLQEQVESILSQQDVEVTLRICDDNSPDNTYPILRDFADEHPNVLISSNIRNLGVGMNFMQMVYEEHESSFDYYAFSDQDDIWDTRKLSSAISMIEDCMGPVLYYSDVIDFDATREWSELEKYRDVLNHPDTLFLRNWASGCTMVFNKRLRDLLCEQPLQTFPRIHDSWVHLVAQYCGTVIPDFGHSFIRRRITGANVVGELTDHHTSFKQAVHSLSNMVHGSDHAPSRTARQLLDCYGSLMSPKSIDTVSLMARCEHSFSARIKAAFTIDYWQPTWKGRLLIFLCFLFGRY